MKCPQQKTPTSSRGIIKLVKYFINFVKIIKLGKIERNLLDRVINGDDMGALTANQRRSLSSLESKGLIEIRDGKHTATALADQIALTAKDKNRVRNENRTAHRFGTLQGTNATYVYRARKIAKGYGGKTLTRLIASGEMTFNQALVIKAEIDYWVELMAGEGMAEAEIESMAIEVITKLKTPVGEQGNDRVIGDRRGSWDSNVIY